MGERFISRFRQEAKKNLTHYFRLIGKKAGIDWEWILNEEIGSIVDDIISAVKEELLHEIESAAGGV
jgi:hypothetical protein